MYSRRMTTTRNANHDTSSRDGQAVHGNNEPLAVLLTQTAICCFHMTAKTLCTYVCVCVCVCVCVFVCVSLCYINRTINSVSPLKNFENNSVKYKVK